MSPSATGTSTMWLAWQRTKSTAGQDRYCQCRASPHKRIVQHLLAVVAVVTQKGNATTVLRWHQNDRPRPTEHSRRRPFRLPLQDAGDTTRSAHRDNRYGIIRTLPPREHTSVGRC